MTDSYRHLRYDEREALAKMRDAATVVALTCGDLGSHPKGPPQSRITVLGQHRAASECTGLPGRKIKTAELQELTVMAEAA